MVTLTIKINMVVSVAHLFFPHMLALNKSEECAKCVGYPPGIVHGELSDRQSFGPLGMT